MCPVSPGSPTAASAIAEQQTGSLPGPLHTAQGQHLPATCLAKPTPPALGSRSESAQQCQSLPRVSGTMCRATKPAGYLVASTSPEGPGMGPGLLPLLWALQASLGDAQPWQGWQCLGPQFLHHFIHLHLSRPQREAASALRTLWAPGHRHSLFSEFSYHTPFSCPAQPPTHWPRAAGSSRPGSPNSPKGTKPLPSPDFASDSFPGTKPHCTDGGMAIEHRRVPRAAALASQLQSAHPSWPDQAPHRLG